MQNQQKPRKEVISQKLHPAYAVSRRTNQFFVRVHTILQQ